MRTLPPHLNEEFPHLNEEFPNLNDDFDKLSTSPSTAAFFLKIEFCTFYLKSSKISVCYSKSAVLEHFGSLFILQLYLPCTVTSGVHRKRKRDIDLGLRVF